MLAAAAAAALAMRKSLASQQAERDLWAEATDDVR
ncbi:MAG: DLW-39 family protein [Dermatophilaceae bacterium]